MGTFSTPDHYSHRRPLTPPPRAGGGSYDLRFEDQMSIFLQNPTQTLTRSHPPEDIRIRQIHTAANARWTL